MATIVWITRAFVRQRKGNTLIELVAATTVLAIALVPALRLMRDALAVEEEIEYASAMATLCASQLEQSLAKTSASWNTSSESGNYSSIGYARLKYSVTKSDAPANGGLTNQLLAITATVWDDTDSDNALDSGERRVQFSTKLAKLAVYNTD
jgi:Tfp pilus assembly protein PilE